MAREFLMGLIGDIMRLADPYWAIGRCIEVKGGVVYICGRGFRAGNVAVIAIGKAASRSIDAAVDKLNAPALAVIPMGWPRPRARGVRVVESTHPLPSALSLKACEEVLNFLNQLREGDLAILIATGGGSALVECPRPPLTIEELAAVNDAMLKAGLTIREVNIVRKHLSMFKGGWLAKTLEGRGVNVVGLYVSDVPGDDPSLIASGPTVADPSTFRDAIEVLRVHGLWGRLPGRVMEVLEQGARGLIEETPKSVRAYNEVVLTNMDLLKGLKTILENEGYRALILTSRMSGEAREVGRFIASIALDLRRLEGRSAILAGGEPTVTVRGLGKGGRTMELAAGFAMGLHGECSGDEVSMLAIATDGIDGNTDAAGAYADCSTVSRARSMGLDAAKYLENNDTYSLFNALGDVVKTGPTGLQLNMVSVTLVRGN